MNKSSQFGFVLLIFIIFGILSCAKFNNIGEIKVKDSKVGFQVQSDGHVIESSTIPTDAEKIYFETFLDIPSNSEITLEFKWYNSDKLIYSYTGQHSGGYVIATLERDPTKLSTFQSGEYVVQVWFFNTMLDEVSFSVQ